MDVQISNFKGITSARFSIKGITIIGGKNGSGKTSIQQAVGAALTNDYIPSLGQARYDAMFLVQNGKATSEVSIKGKDVGNISVFYPSMKSTGSGLHASRVAMGLDRISQMKNKERSVFVSDFIGCKPTKQELIERLKDFTTEVQAKVWESIEGLGWDSAYKQSQEKGTKLKGAWELIAGERYGKNKAENYTPEGWIAFSHRGKTLEEAERDVSEAEKAVKKCSGKNEMLKIDLNRLKALAGQKASLEEKSKESFLKQIGLKAELEELKGKEKHAREKHLFSGNSCPNCGQYLKVNPGGGIDVLNYAKLARTPQQRTELEIEQKKALTLIGLKNGQIEEHTNIHNEICVKLKEAEKAGIDFAKFEEENKDTVSSIRSIQFGNKEIAKEFLTGGLEEAEIALNQTKKVYEAIRTKEQAEYYHNKIKSNAQIQSVLSPDGIRLFVLSKKIGEVNIELSSLCARAKWGKLVIGDYLDISYDGKPYWLLSESEQYRVDVIMQVYIAERDKSQLIIFDRTDLLDGKGRNGLVRLMKTIKIDCLVLMTLNDPSELPEADYLTTCWLEKGVLNEKAN